MPRILLVEDNEANQDLIARYLELYGHEVTVAGDGQAGLTAAARDRDRIDLILMDMNLPRMDGWTVTRRLKADGATRGIPVIAITAHAMVGDRQRALEAGCDDYVSKPIDFRTLLHKIDSHCCKALPE